MAQASSDQWQLVWWDANINTPDNATTKIYLSKLYKKFHDFSDIDECKRYITRLNAMSGKCVVIVSGKLGEELTEHIHRNPHVMHIYVYCGDRERAESWAKKYDKVNHFRTFIFPRFFYSIKLCRLK